MNILPTIMLAAATALGLPAVMAEDESPSELRLNDKSKRISYSLGYQIGGDFKRQGVEMNADAVVLGITDALAESDPKIPRKAMFEILSELKRRIVAGDAKRNNQASRTRERELEYVAEGREFLKQNADKPGVATTASGLQYKIIDPGSENKPKTSDRVTVNYRGSLVNGRVFDSSYNRGEPATFKLDGVIKGWTEGLQLIGEGGRIQLFIPHVLAYRTTGPLAHRTLIFDVELLAIGKDV